MVQDFEKRGGIDEPCDVVVGDLFVWKVHLLHVNGYDGTCGYGVDDVVELDGG
jgi:hypothetical protein